MMRACRTVLFLAVLLAALAFTLPTARLDNLEVVEPRVAAQYADHIQHESLPAVPGALLALLD